jgi:hypothetical protein
MDNQPQHNLSDLEDIVSELQFLSKKQPVQDDDLLRLKELMRILKESGYTNKEISTLTREKWSEPTIKLYTRGTNIKDSRPDHNLIARVLLKQALTDFGR